MAKYYIKKIISTAFLAVSVCLIVISLNRMILEGLVYLNCDAVTEGTVIDHYAPYGQETASEYKNTTMYPVIEYYVDEAPYQRKGTVEIDSYPYDKKMTVQIRYNSTNPKVSMMKIELLDSAKVFLIYMLAAVVMFIFHLLTKKSAESNPFKEKVLSRSEKEPAKG